MDETTIEDAAEAPKKMKTGMGEVEEHPLPDLIAAHQYVQAQTAKTKPARGIRFTKLVPPGTA